MLDSSKYERIRLLAKGAAAEIFLARDPGSSEQVVLKMLRPELSADSELVGRFLDEAQLCREFEHDNIVRHLAFGRGDDGRLFLVSEYLDGEDLKTYLRGNPPLSAEATISLMLPLCSALDYVHMQGVLHRDLKPENVVLVGGLHAFRPKLIDFGNAWSAMNRFRTAPGGVVGTPEYSAPECIRGEFATPRSDIYSLGILMFECLLGTPPFTGPDLGSIWRQHLEDLPPALPESLSALELIIRRCLAKDPLARFGTAAEVADALNAIRGLSPEVAARDLRKGLPSASWNLAPPKRPDAMRGELARVQLPATVISQPGIARVPVVGAPAASAAQDNEPSRDELASVRKRGPWGIVAAGAVVGLLVTWAVWPEPPPEPAPAPSKPAISGRTRDLFPAPVRRPSESANRPSQVTLELSSVPEGAAVFRVDTGERLGSTPLVWKTTQAQTEVAVRFVLAGYTPVERKVRLSANAFVETALREAPPPEPPEDDEPGSPARKRPRATNQSRDSVLDPYGPQ